MRVKLSLLKSTQSATIKGQTGNMQVQIVPTYLFKYYSNNVYEQRVILS